MKDLVRKYLGEQEANKRPTLMANQVEMNENGLRRLLVRYSAYFVVGPEAVKANLGI